MGYYFISVGGSGARVLEALTHLCAAGLMPNQEKIGHFYAMAIDPDSGNGNLTRTHRLLNSLNGFQSVDVGKNTPLLKTRLNLPDGPHFVWSPTPLGRSLDNIISYHAFRDKPLGKLYRSLYTKKEREMILDEGFRGRPSIGAAVMAKKANIDGAHKVAHDTAWQNLINVVKTDVRENGSAQIFLAGSIFGGTGAAGLPTIVRILRDVFAKNCANGTVRIGGALLLPYFSFSPTEEEKRASGIFASSENFLTNTKAALRYYADTGGSGYDSIYFVGDNTMKSMRNFSIGAADQCNDAHIVDLFAAMAAVHFYQSTERGYCYYISRGTDNEFKWSDLPNVQMYDETMVPAKERFVQFTRFIFAYLHMVKPIFRDLEAKRISRDDYPWYDYLQNIKSGSSEVLNFEEYAEKFAEWLNQVENSAGEARSVKLINPQSFSVENNHAKINTALFSTLGYDISRITIDEIFRTRLNSSGGGGFWERIFGGNRNVNEDFGQGFGLFLRRLYDSCKAS